MKKYFQAPWDIRDITIIFTISSALLVVAFLGIQFSGLAELISESKNSSMLLLGTFIVQWLLITAPLIIFTSRKYKLKWKHFGFKKVKPLKLFGYVLWGYFLYLGISLIVAILIVYTNLKIPGYQIQEKLVPFFGSDIFSLAIAGGVIVFVAPIIEEIFFRGFLLRGLSNRIGVFGGSAISAAIFAIFHLQPSNIIPIFILGVIINSIVIKSKSLWPAIMFHIFNNAIAFTIEVLIIKEVISIENLV